MSVKCQMSHVKCCQKGFALLFAVLASSVMLSISVAILNIALREVILSSFGRESVIAFYAADSGAECALYWGTGLDVFSGGKISPINCGGGIQNVGGGGLDPKKSTFNLQLGGNSSAPCATVEVTKNDLAQKTKIESFGHNTCNILSPTQLERALRVNY